jgi:alkaline phosphatase
VLGLAQAINATQHERQTQDWNGDGRVDAADVRVAPPFKDPFNPTTPSLITMARGALNVLSQNHRGFFLLVEGGAVDHAAHKNQPGRLIEEQVEFNHTVRAICDWVNAHSNWEETLVIVSADHETGLLWGSNSDTVAFDPMLNRGMHRAPAMWFNTGGHSNSLVPLRARGAGASLFARHIAGSDPVVGDYVENTTIFDVMKAAFGSSESGVRDASIVKRNYGDSNGPDQDDGRGLGNGE